MTEFDVMPKDYIKLGFYNEVINQNSVEFSVFLESEGTEKNFLDVRENKNVYRFNNFNVSEDAAQNTITFRPIVIGCYSYFKIKGTLPLTVEIIKNGTTMVAKQFVLAPGENTIEFDPQGNQKYIMKIEENPVTSSPPLMFSTPVTFSTPAISNTPEDAVRRDQLLQSNARLESDICSLQEEINALQAKNEQLVNNKKNLISHLETLQAEYDKDYASYESDIEEIKSKFAIDEEILKMYADKEVTPIEDLIARSENDIREIEEQTRIFIEAQQRRTAGIEKELRIGKKD